MRCESRYTSRIRAVLGVLLVASGLVGRQSHRAMGGPQEVQPTTMHGKVLCGYQGWFRCPGDPAGMGWIHPPDEVDEGTAVFKATSSPPAQGHFVGLEGLPSDWCLRLVGAAASRLRQRQPIPLEIPLSATAPDEPPPTSGSRDSSRRFTKPWHLDLPRPLMAAAWERIKHLDIPGVPADRHFGFSGPAFYLSPTGDDAAEVQPILPQPAWRVPHPLWPDRRGLVRWPLRRRPQR
jgi:hypothetical protein